MDDGQRRKKSPKRGIDVKVQHVAPRQRSRVHFQDEELHPLAKRNRISEYQHRSCGVWCCPGYSKEGRWHESEASSQTTATGDELPNQGMTQAYSGPGGTPSVTSVSSEDVTATYSRPTGGALQLHVQGTTIVAQTPRHHPGNYQEAPPTFSNLPTTTLNHNLYNVALPEGQVPNPSDLTQQPQSSYPFSEASYHQQYHRQSAPTHEDYETADGRQERMHNLGCCYCNQQPASEKRPGGISAPLHLAARRGPGGKKRGKKGRGKRGSDEDHPTLQKPDERSKGGKGPQRGKDKGSKRMGEHDDTTEILQASHPPGRGAGGAGESKPFRPISGRKRAMSPPIGPPSNQGEHPRDKPGEGPGPEGGRGPGPFGSQHGPAPGSAPPGSAPPGSAPPGSAPPGSQRPFPGFSPGAQTGHHAGLIHGDPQIHDQGARSQANNITHPAAHHSTLPAPQGLSSGQPSTGDQHRLYEHKSSTTQVSETTPPGGLSHLNPNVKPKVFWKKHPGDNFGTVQIRYPNGMSYMLKIPEQVFADSRHGNPLMATFLASPSMQLAVGLFLVSV